MPVEMSLQDEIHMHMVQMLLNRIILHRYGLTTSLWNERF